MHVLRRSFDFGIKAPATSSDDRAAEGRRGPKDASARDRRECSYTELCIAIILGHHYIPRAPDMVADDFDPSSDSATADDARLGRWKGNQMIPFLVS